ncbi:Hsp70 family protein [Propioniciclava flava]
MRLGIDFGTTRTIVAVADRGNYPVVGFDDPDGDSVDYFPSVAARVGDHIVYGFAALEAARDGAPLVRSFKRALAAGSLHPDASVDLGGRNVRLSVLVAGFLTALRDALVTSSTMSDVLSDEEPLEAMVAVPAHAHTAQRLLTLDAFAAAGFSVAGLVNEPSAAAFEYTHRQARTLNARRSRVVVYDLGGGTFDASLVQVTDLVHEVEASVGINRLGGDDFDAALARCAMSVAGDPVLTPDQEAALLEDARAGKEMLSPQSRRIPLRVAGKDVSVGVDAFYEAAAPLVRETVPRVGAPAGERRRNRPGSLPGGEPVSGGRGQRTAARGTRVAGAVRAPRASLPSRCRIHRYRVGHRGGSGFWVHLDRSSLARLRRLPGS